MSKLLLNLLLQISKALVNSKIQFLIQKFFFLTFGPADLAAHSTFGLASLAVPAGQNLPRQPIQPEVGVRFPFWFTPSELVASPSSLCQAGPGCLLRPSPPAARARPCRHGLPATPRRPALHYICHPCYCYGYVDPISVDYRIWGDGNEICWCGADSSTLCPV
jgi:hypothetical protein